MTSDTVSQKEVVAALVFVFGLLLTMVKVFYTKTEKTEKRLIEEARDCRDKHEKTQIQLSAVSSKVSALEGRESAYVAVKDTLEDIRTTVEGLKG